MSADKHKKRDRAYAFLRSIRRQRRLAVAPDGTVGLPFSGTPSRIMLYCVERGMAQIRRVRWWDRSNTNIFVDQ
jgi:hypothetical protein